ncbi:MAG: PspC domain-containing protein [Flavobacteriaceae bacterium]|nr:PspC domain-containing protein [Flavobacteriaceae bacterium]
MNKTININLGGVFFHIDEMAYQKLKRYLDAIRRSLSDDPKGRDEIITDIESRIGELLSEKIKDIRQVVNENDIDEVVEVMGKPEDYMVDDEVFDDSDYQTYKRSNNKKLYRDGNDKFLGGVSSGIAHYFSVDVIWIRLAWLVAAFGFGFGFIVYPILWILLPQANTTAEKLEMEGEDVNISNIEKKIKDELTEASERVKNGIHEVSDKVKNADYTKYRDKAKSGSQDMVETLGKIFTAIFMVIGKFIGVLLIIISVTTILGLLIGSFTIGSLDFIQEDWFYQNTMAYNNSGLPIWIISVLTFILVGIPFFFLFSLGLRILSNNSKSIGKVAKLSLFGIWLVALLFAIFFGTKQFMQSAYDGSDTNNQEINMMANDTLNIKLVDNKNFSNHSELKRRWGYNMIFDENNVEKVYSNNIRLNVYASDNDQVYVKTRKKSQGRSRTAARENAEMIKYDFQLLENELRFDGYFLADVKNKFREQKVYIDLYIPENQTIYLDKSTRSFLYDVANTQNIYDRDMAKHYFKMTDTGLTCLDCEGYEYRDNEASDAFNMKIDKKGVHIEVNDESNEKVEVKIDENGLVITSSKDSI